MQTLGGGIARISFPDGALFVVKPDTLIVIEESAGIRNDKLASNVAVQVTSGVVDLSTASGSADSRVMFSNAEARGSPGKQGHRRQQSADQHPSNYRFQRSSQFAARRGTGRVGAV